MVWEWLGRYIFLREQYREMDEALEFEFRRFDENCRHVQELDKRIKASFTPEEWEETRKRCEAKLGVYGQP